MKENISIHRNQNNNTNKNKRLSLTTKSILLLFLIISTIGITLLPKTNSLVYPETIQTYDRIRNINNKIDDKYFYIYNVYYRGGSTTLYNTRLGLIYTPKTINCSSGASNSQNTWTNIVFNSQTFSDLYLLHENNYTCGGGASAILSVPLRIDATSTTFSFIVAFTVVNNSNASKNLTIKLFDGFNYTVTLNTTGESIPAYSIKLFRMDLSLINGDLNNVNANMEGNASTATGRLSGGNFNFSVFSDNALGFTTITLSQVTGSNAHMSTTGNPDCTVAGVSCLEKYYCPGTSCSRCHASCLTCNGPNSTNCLSCERHTKQWKTGPSSNRCESKYNKIL